MVCPTEPVTLVLSWRTRNWPCMNPIEHICDQINVSFFCYGHHQLIYVTITPLTPLPIARICQEITHTGVATPDLVTFCVEMYSFYLRPWPIVVLVSAHHLMTSNVTRNLKYLPQTYYSNELVSNVQLCSYNINVPYRGIIVMDDNASRCTYLTHAWLNNTRDYNGCLGMDMLFKPGNCSSIVQPFACVTLILCLIVHCLQRLQVAIMPFWCICGCTSYHESMICSA